MALKIRSLLVALALVGATSPGVRAAEDTPTRVHEANTSSGTSVSVIAETHDFDQLAVEASLRLGGSRFSLFAGVGYLPQDGEDERLQGIATFGGGGRVHTGWFRHHGYVELSWGPLERALRSPRGEQYLVYGPSLLLGYQSVARSGLTFLAAAGYGYTHSSELGRDVHNPELRLGVGYSWGARAARRRSLRLRTRASACGSAN